MDGHRPRRWEPSRLWDFAPDDSGDSTANFSAVEAAEFRHGSSPVRVTGPSGQEDHIVHSKQAGSIRLFPPAPSTPCLFVQNPSFVAPPQSRHLCLSE